MLISRDRWLVVMLRPRRSTLRHKVTEECRLLIAPSEHGRNGLGQLRRVWWLSHSAFNHDWVSYIFSDYLRKILTSTNIRIMEEIAEIRSFEHNIGVSVCAQPVRPVQPTGQTGLHGTITGSMYSNRSDRSHSELTSLLNLG